MKPIVSAVVWATFVVFVARAQSGTLSLLLLRYLTDVNAQIVESMVHGWTVTASAPTQPRALDKQATRAIPANYVRHDAPPSPENPTPHSGVWRGA